jgi:hypothetical protein
MIQITISLYRSSVNTTVPAGCAPKWPPILSHAHCKRSINIMFNEYSFVQLHFNALQVSP